MKKFRLTLIEVIVVVGVCFLLAAIFLPVIHMRKESSKKIACVGNLKNIGLSFRMYSNVYGEAFPDKNGRTGLQMLAYTGFLENTQVYVCPSTEKRVPDTSFIASNSTYCYAGGLTEGNSVDSALGGDSANNHDFYGQLLFVDGHVKGYAGASWSSNGGGSHLTDF